MADVESKNRRRLIAEGFVSLVQRMHIHSSSSLSASHFDEIDRKRLIDVLGEAGYENRILEEGALLGYYFDQDRSLTRETYRINPRLLFKVKSRNLSYTVGWGGEFSDDVRATSWLDCLFRRIDLNEQALASIGLVDVVCDEISKERPLDPIVLNRFGDRMEFHRRPLATRSLPMSDADRLEEAEFYHQHCEGGMELMHTSPKWNFLVCKKCFLRMPVPSDLATIGEFREWLNPM